MTGQAWIEKQRAPFYLVIILASKILETRNMHVSYSTSAREFVWFCFFPK